MRKILTVFITFVFMFILVGCNQMTAEDSTQNDGLTSEQEILLELAKENEADVSKVLRRDSSKEFQSALAKTNGRVQEALIQYEGLNPEVLVEICQNPKFANIDYHETKKLLIDAIKNADLTPEQEMQILKTDKSQMHLGILSRKNLNAESLIYLLERNNTFWFVINVENNPQIGELVTKHILSGDFNTEQILELKALDIRYIDEALLEREGIKKEENK